MSQMKWLDLLGWTEEELGDLRFVGYSYIKQGHYEIALKFFEALVILCPESVYDIQTTGAIHLELGNNMAALNYFEKALQIERDHGPTLLNRAKALLLLGYHKQGLAEAQNLKVHEDARISGQAEALILGYS